MHSGVLEVGDREMVIIRVVEMNVVKVRCWASGKMKKFWKYSVIHT